MGEKQTALGVHAQDLIMSNIAMGFAAVEKLLFHVIDAAPKGCECDGKNDRAMKNKLKEHVHSLAPTLDHIGLEIKFGDKVDTIAKLNICEKGYDWKDKFEQLITRAERVKKEYGEALRSEVPKKLAIMLNMGSRVFAILATQEPNLLEKIFVDCDEDTRNVTTRRKLYCDPGSDTLYVSDTCPYRLGIVFEPVL